MTRDEAIEAFWRFWEDNALAIGDGIRDRTLDRFIEPISEHVRAIDPALDWEFGKGFVAQHYFCLAPKGDARLRLLTEQWRSRGLRDGDVFEFHATRPGSGYLPGASLDFGEAVFDFASFRVVLTPDEGRERIDVVLHHPAFPKVSEKLRSTASFVTLDALLGEDDVERFVGLVNFQNEPLDGAETLAALVDAVATLRRTATRERFALLKWTNQDGSPAFAMINRALKRIDHLGFDTHYAVVIPLRDPTDAGLTTAEEAEELNALEDELIDELGPHAACLGRTTMRGLRTILFFAGAAGEGARGFEAFARRHVARGVEVLGSADPQWDAARPY